MDPSESYSGFDDIKLIGMYFDKSTLTYQLIPLLNTVSCGIQMN